MEDVEFRVRRIKDITQKDIGIPTFMASSSELTSNPEEGHFVYGYGTHPDARVALMRLQALGVTDMEIKNMARLMDFDPISKDWKM